MWIKLPPHKASRVLALVALSVGGVAVGRWSGREIELRRNPWLAPPSLPRAGEPLADPILHDMHGAPRMLSAYVAEDRILVLVVFNPRCSSCVAEAQTWQQLQNRHYPRVSFLAVASGTTDREYLALLTRTAGLTFPMGVADSDFAKAIRAVGLPTIYGLDGQRRVLFAAAGPKATSMVTDWLADAN